MSGPVVVLAGGTGGAKLARGMLDVVGPDELTVIANTGDDIEIYGGYVSPDVDLVTFWLADRIDERGWGLAGDTFNVMAGLRALGREVWFSLGDLDLAIALQRSLALARGRRLTEAQLTILQALGVGARVLPMSDQPVRTRVMAADRWWPLQEFLINSVGAGGWGPIQGVQLRGAGGARATPEALDAIARARAIVIGPSNPIISIGPILAVSELRAAIARSPAPVVAVSPFVEGIVLKGPTAEFMRWRGLPASAASLVTLYEGLIDGLVSDERLPSVTLRTDVMMDGAEGRKRLAAETLEFAITVRKATAATTQ
ncbi:MAG: 2-phospho-L-lactate transferase CofD family protein [Solirubrobacteraceae bacterium]